MDKILINGSLHNQRQLCQEFHTHNRGDKKRETENIYIVKYIKYTSLLVIVNRYCLKSRMKTKKIMNIKANTRKK